MISLWKDPKGNYIFGRDQNNTHAVNVVSSIQPNVKDFEEIKERINSIDKRVNSVGVRV